MCATDALNAPFLTHVGMLFSPLSKIRIRFVHPTIIDFVCSKPLA
jgi:hypothetical protein